MPRYLTHFHLEGLPSSGNRKLTYLTQEEDSKEFFLGMDNNPIPIDRVRRWLHDGHIVQIKKVLFPSPESFSLFIDKDGLLFFADSFFSEDNQIIIGIYDTKIVPAQFFQEGYAENI